MKNTVNINGRAYVGGSIVITNGKVMLNGVEVTPDGKEIYINVQGNIDYLKVDHCDDIVVSGDVKEVSVVSGDLKISGNVTGNVSNVSGDVCCGAVTGNVSTVSGDIN